MISWKEHRSYAAYLRHLANIARDWGEDPSEAEVEERCRIVRRLRHQYGVSARTQDTACDDWSSIA